MNSQIRWCKVEASLPLRRKRAWRFDRGFWHNLATCPSLWQTVWWLSPSWPWPGPWAWPKTLQPCGGGEMRHTAKQQTTKSNHSIKDQWHSLQPLILCHNQKIPSHLVKHLLLRVMWFTSAGSRHYVGVANGWQLWLPSLSYPRGNYINSRTNACMSACVHQQTTDKALITPRGVDWMNFTAEYSSFLPMCLTFVMITCLALDYHNTHLTVHYRWHLGLQFNLEYINAGGSKERKHSLNKTMHGFLLIFLCDRTLTWQASWIRWLFSLWASHWLLSTRRCSRDQALIYGKKNRVQSLF